MVVSVTDASSLVYNYLKVSTDARAVAVRDTLVSGADSVIETGDLTEAKLRAAQDLRLADASKLDLALFVEVQDAGEAQIGAPGIYDARVVVRALDRGCSYRNLRRTKNALREALSGVIGPLVAGAGGVFEVRYAGRSGHRYDSIVGIEYDALTIVVPIELPYF
ncbi:MAG: hypothetical protein WC391_07985 [Methanoregula sp.]|jgi:hypothetical protein